MAEPDQSKTISTSRKLIPVLLFNVIGNIGIALRSVQSLEDSHRWVDHTWEVIAQVERVISVAKDAKTGSRGYLLTVDENPNEEKRRRAFNKMVVTRKQDRF